MSIDELLNDASLSQKLRDDFTVLAKLYGPVRAFELFVGEMNKATTGDDAEDRVVRLCRALYDDYTEAKPEAP